MKILFDDLISKFTNVSVRLTTEWIIIVGVDTRVINKLIYQIWKSNELSKIFVCPDINILKFHPFFKDNVVVIFDRLEIEKGKGIHRIRIANAKLKQLQLN